MRVVRIVDIEEQPWKNGAGTTRQVAVGQGWRVSVAHVTKDGPFSVFEATWRHSIVIDGGALHLSCANEEVLLQSNELSSYVGDVAWDCRLQGEAATVLNIMCERDVAAADILIGHWASALTRSDPGLLIRT